MFLGPRASRTPNIAGETPAVPGMVSSSVWARASVLTYAIDFALRRFVICGSHCAAEPGAIGIFVLHLSGHGLNGFINRPPLFF